MNNLGPSGLVKMLDGFKNRKAIAISYIGFIDESGIKLFKGETKGKILEKANDESLYGCDGLFVPENCDKPYNFIFNSAIPKWKKKR